MSVSGYWCALILLTFTRDSLGSHYEKLQVEKLQVEKPNLRHQQNHRSSYVDRKLADSTDFHVVDVRSTRNTTAEIHSIRSIAENRPSERNHRAADIQRELGNHRADVRSIAHQSAVTRRMENRPEQIRSMENPAAGTRPTGNRAVAMRYAENPPAERRSLEIASGRIHGAPTDEARPTEKRAARIRSAEDREISPTEIRPVDASWTEQAETSVERSQIRHGRSRSHFARQKMEDSSKDSLRDAVTGRPFDRIKTDVRNDRENRFKTRQAERSSGFQEGFVPPRNYSRLPERDSPWDKPMNNGRSLDRTEDSVSVGLESFLKLYQAKKGSVSNESSTVSLMRNHSWLAGKNLSGTGRSFDRIKADGVQKVVENMIKARHVDNHGVLRSSVDVSKDFFKDDPLSKLRKAISFNKTMPAYIDRNETVGIESGVEEAVEFTRDLEEEILQDVVLDYTSYEEPANASDRARKRPEAAQVDIVTRFLRIIENQHTLGENCTAGTDLNLGEGVVDQYAQERFRLEANFAVNRANMLTRLWKYAPEVMLSSEYLLHASVLSMVEFDEDIFAAGNCYDKLQYRDRWLYCPFAHRLPNQDGILVKDLAIEYKYLSNSSEWFYIARKNAERVIASYEQFSRGKCYIA